MDNVLEAWSQLAGPSTATDEITLPSLIFHLSVGGLLSLYVRVLFRRCSVSASATDSISRVFPLLTIITTAVIAVVKSSLALSLGLVGALSIVRFRAAIKEPEELVYLFLCIAVGLALGAQQAVIALGLVFVATLFILWMHFTTRVRRDQSLLLTITGDSEQYFANDASGVFSAIDQVATRYVLQRCDIEEDRGQVRVVLAPTKKTSPATMIKKLRELLPGCELSYVNLNSPV